MAPIICQAVDAAGSGLPGMRVLLHCWDDRGSPVSQFFAYTGNDGVIRVWFPIACPMYTIYEAAFIDAFDFPSVRITYLTAEYFGAGLLPWVDISTNLHLIGNVQHTVTLRASENTSRFGIQHEHQPLDAWMCSCTYCRRGHVQLGAASADHMEIETSSNSTWCQEAQSPSDSLGCWSSPEDVDDGGIMRVIIRKRKAEFSEEDLPPAKKRRLGERKGSMAETV